MIVIFTGSRNLPDEIAHAEVEVILLRLMVVPGLFVCVGDCPTGLDAAVRARLLELQLQHKVFRADWDKHGKAAGPIRNSEMVNEALVRSANIPITCFAFPYGKSTGTRDCMRKALAAGAIVRSIEYPPTQMSGQRIV